MINIADLNTGWAEQDVTAALDYSADWSALLSGGDTIATSVWSAPAGLTLSNQTLAGAVATVRVHGGMVGQNYHITNTVTTAQGRQDVRAFMLLITDITAPTASSYSALFKNSADALSSLRTGIMAMQCGINTALLTDEYLYGELLAAEADAARRLRVYFEPTQVFAGPPSSDEIAAVTTNKWVEEAAYDYEPDMWNMTEWGYLVLRNKLVSSIASVQFIYPLPVAGSYVLPSNWIRLDKKAGHLRFVPSGTTMMSGAFGSFLISMMAGGNVVPGMIQIRYIAGMQNAAIDYPDLPGLVKRMAVLRVLQDSFTPQSASVSADGLSQSQSLDLDKYSADVESRLEALRSSLHGIRVMVL